MHISLDSALGRQRRLNSVGESVLQIAPDAAAAYSLRSLTGGDPDVVRVRRESDNTEKDFSGSQIESGEMARWVNEQPTLPLDLRELDTNTGERDGALIEAAAAYSLRKLKEDFTGDVVEVRRNVDGETEGFTADEVTDGTMEGFVNASFDDELPLDQATGAAAAYSLRSLKASGTDVTTSGDTDGDTTGKYVVQVRRSSDDAVQSFTASEVADGTLEDWVNTDVTVYQSDFSSGANGWNGASVVTLVGGEDGVSDGTTSKDNVLKLIKNQDSQAYIARDQGVIAGLTYTVSGSLYAPSSNTGVDGILIKDGIAGGSLSNYPSGYLTASGVWTDFSFSYTATVSGDQRINMGISSLGSNPNGSSAGSAGDVVYISDLQFVETTSNGHVKTWYDQSGSDNHATQTDPTKQPKIVDGGNLLKDSRNNPAIDFDDVDDTMDLTSDLVTGGAYSVIAYHEFNAPTMILKGDLNSPRIRSTGTTNYQVNSYSPDVSSNFTVASTQGLVSFIKDTGNNGRLYADGTESSSGQQAIGSGSAPFTTLGAQVSDGPGDGKLVEVIYYESDQSDNRTAIEANIGETYGITAIPAANDTVNGFVQTWYDQSGSGNDAEQIAADKQPKIVGEVTSGEPHAFLGAIDFAESGTKLVNAAVGSTTEASVFSVITRGTNTTSGARAVGYSEVSSTAGTLAFTMDNSIRFDGAAATNSTLTIPSSGDFSSTTIKVSNTEANHYLNGASNILNSSLTLSDTDLTYSIGAVGAGTTFNGTVKEAIFYNSDQSSSRTAIEENIANQYGITLS